MSEQDRSLPEGNYELQQQFLDSEQKRISSVLFESGAISNITQVVKVRSGLTTEVHGFSELEKTFVPSMAMIDDRGHQEAQLSLVAITPDPGRKSKGYSYMPLGRIDSAGILFPYPNVPPEDAGKVYQAALELMQARDNGVLPNLNFNLLSISNPNTAISSSPPPEQV